MSFIYTDTIYPSAEFQAIAYGMGTYVAVGEAIFINTDKETWTQSTSPFTSIINDVRWINNEFVAVDRSSNVGTSPDGVTWTLKTTTGLSNVLYSIDYMDGIYVAVGSFFSIYTSPDLETWTEQLLIGGLKDSFQQVRNNGIVHIAVGSSGLIYTASDPTGTWSPQVSNTAVFLFDVHWNGSIWVSVGQSGKIITSTNSGSTWVIRPSGTTEDIYSVIWNGIKFYCMGKNGYATSSFNGTSWVIEDSTVINLIRGGLAANNLLFFVGEEGQYLYTDNFLPPPVDLTIVENASYIQEDWGSEIIHKAYQKAGHYAMGWTNSGDIVVLSGSSVDISGNIYVADSNETIFSGGVTTAEVTVGGTTDFYGCATDGTTTIVVGLVGAVWYTTNGSSWTNITVGTKNLWHAQYLNGYFYICGLDGTIYRSSSGTGSYTDVGITTTNDIRDIGYADGVYIASTDNSGAIYRSTNGTSWTLITSPHSASHNEVATDGAGNWVIAGGAGYNSVSTDDGLNWSKIACAIGWTMYGMTHIDVGGTSRFITTFSDDIKTSDNNGSTWTTRTLPASGETLLSLSTDDDGVAHVVGRAGRGFYSTDGITWVQESTYTTTDAWQINTLGGIYVTGGEDGDAVYGSSGDGPSSGEYIYYDGTTWTDSFTIPTYDNFKRGYYDGTKRAVGYIDGTDLIPVVRNIGTQI